MKIGCTFHPRSKPYCADVESLGISPLPGLLQIKMLENTPTKEDIEFLADTIAASANRAEPLENASSDSTKWQARCPNPLHGYTGELRDTYRAAKDDAEDHDDNFHNGKTYTLVIKNP